MILSANFLLVIPMILFIQHSMQKEFESALFYSFNQTKAVSTNLFLIEKKVDETLLNTLVSDQGFQDLFKAKDTAGLKHYLDQKAKVLPFEHLMVLDEKRELYTEDGRSTADGEQLQHLAAVQQAYNTQCAVSSLEEEAGRLLRYSTFPLLRDGQVVGSVVAVRQIAAGLLEKIVHGTDIALMLLHGKKVLAATSEELNSGPALDVQQLQWLVQHPEKSMKHQIGQRNYYLTTQLLKQEPLQEPLLLVLTVKESFFAYALDEVMHNMIMVFLLALLIITLLVIILSHKIQVLFHAFVKFTQQIKQGDYETKIDINTNDEIQLLAENLEDMRQAIYLQDRSLHDYALSLGEEVDERARKLKVQSTYLQTILDIQNELIVVINAKGLSYANQACLKFWGVDNLQDLKKMCDLPKFFGYDKVENFNTLLTKREVFKTNINVEKKPGERYFFEVKFYPVEEETNSYMVILNDVTAHAEEKQQLYLQATTDRLTNLPNRFDFENRLSYVLEQIKRTREDAVFCLIDIDNFKKVNDTYGHLVGDQVLVKVAMILQENIRQSDLVARWGGEEFVVVLYPTTFTSARNVLETLRKKIEEEFLDFSCQLTCSFGATVLMYDSDIDQVFQKADEALYAAKADGKNCVRFSIDLVV